MEAAVEAALSTATPTATPDIKATVQAQVEATIAAVPTRTPTPQGQKRNPFTRMAIGNHRNNDSKDIVSEQWSTANDTIAYTSPQLDWQQACLVMAI